MPTQVNVPSANVRTRVSAADLQFIIDPQGKHEFAPTVETMEREWRAFRARYGHLPEFAELIRDDIPNKWPERVGRPSWTRRPSTAPFRASEARTAMPQRKG